MLAVPKARCLCACGAACGNPPLDGLCCDWTGCAAPSWAALSVNPTEASGAALCIFFRSSRKIDLTETREAFRGERCIAPPATMPKAAQGAIRGPPLARGTKRGSEQEIGLDRGCTNPATRDQAPPYRSCDRSRPTRGPLVACSPPSA